MGRAVAMGGFSSCKRTHCSCEGRTELGGGNGQKRQNGQNGMDGQNGQNGTGRADSTGNAVLTKPGSTLSFV